VFGDQGRSIGIFTPILTTFHQPIDQIRRFNMFQHQTKRAFSPKKTGILRYLKQPLGDTPPRWAGVFWPGAIIGCNIMSLQRDFIGNFIDRRPVHWRLAR
jgi:hypothetical protein